MYSQQWPFHQSPLAAIFIGKVKDKDPNLVRSARISNQYDFSLPFPILLYFAGFRRLSVNLLAKTCNQFDWEWPSHKIKHPVAACREPSLTKDLKILILKYFIIQSFLRLTQATAHQLGLKWRLLPVAISSKPCTLLCIFATFLSAEELNNPNKEVRS